ncbi:MAG: hypothetical protein J4G05_09285 [Chlorobi bacterium]|nr:hypothetical protein [Chlorobiota bacterium]
MHRPFNTGVKGQSEGRQGDRESGGEDCTAVYGWDDGSLPRLNPICYHQCLDLRDKPFQSMMPLITPTFTVVVRGIFPERTEIFP